MGFEPTCTALQAAASPLGHSTRDSNPTSTKTYPSGRRDSNPRPSPWQGDALPLSHVRTAEPRPDLSGVFRRVTDSSRKMGQESKSPQVSALRSRVREAVGRGERARARAEGVCRAVGCREWRPAGEREGHRVSVRDDGARGRPDARAHALGLLLALASRSASAWMDRGTDRYGEGTERVVGTGRGHVTARTGAGAAACSWSAPVAGRADPCRAGVVGPVPSCQVSSGARGGMTKGRPGWDGLCGGGRYWDRTSDLFRVREARYRCANRPGLFCERTAQGVLPC